MVESSECLDGMMIMKNMSPLQGEIVRLLSKNGQMHAGTIRNELNGSPAGWDVSLDDIEHELRHLEALCIVECMWRLQETQSDLPGGAPRSSDPQSN